MQLNSIHLNVSHKYNWNLCLTDTNYSYQCILLKKTRSELHTWLLCIKMFHDFKSKTSQFSNLLWQSIQTRAVESSSPVRCCPTRPSRAPCRQVTLGLCWRDSRGQTGWKAEFPSKRPIHWWCSHYTQQKADVLWKVTDEPRKEEVRKFRRRGSWDRQKHWWILWDTDHIFNQMYF